MRKTILMIDDEADILEGVNAWLDDEGYHVVTARSGDEGLEKLKQIVPHLILLDIMMPEKDGFQILADLKHDARTSNIPVIMLSARTETSSILNAQHMQATDYVTKPFRTAELLRMIRRYER